MTRERQESDTAPLNVASTNGDVSRYIYSSTIGRLVDDNGDNNVDEVVYVGNTKGAVATSHTVFCYKGLGMDSVGMHGFNGRTPGNFSKRCPEVSTEISYTWIV